MYRLRSIVATEMGVLRTSPLFRPRTESRYCDPIFMPSRSIATLSRTIHIGGGFTSDMLGEYTGPFLLLPVPAPSLREHYDWPEPEDGPRAVVKRLRRGGQV
jgi:hypothetical protein